MIKKLSNLWAFAAGKKTYVVAICAFVYGIAAKNSDAVIFALGIAGLRDGVKTEIAKYLTNK